MGRAPRWDMSYQKNKGLFVVFATPDAHTDWSAEISNHLNRTNREWTTLLEWVQAQPTDAETSNPALMRATMGGTGAWELSNTLETFLMDWHNKGLKKRVKTLLVAEFVVMALSYGGIYTENSGASAP